MRTLGLFLPETSIKLLMIRQEKMLEMLILNDLTLSSLQSTSTPYSSKQFTETSFSSWDARINGVLPCYYKQMQSR